MHTPTDVTAKAMEVVTDTGAAPEAIARVACALGNEDGPNPAARPDTQDQQADLAMRFRRGKVRSGQGRRYRSPETLLESRPVNRDGVRAILQIVEEGSAP